MVEEKDLGIWTDNSLKPFMCYMQFAKLISYLEWYKDRSGLWTWWSNCS